jgi:hypothetical protein
MRSTGGAGLLGWPGGYLRLVSLGGGTSLLDHNATECEVTAFGACHA